MIILVTGGAGYVGSHVALELLEAGHEIVVLDNLSNSQRQAIDRLENLSGRSFPFVEGDVRDSECLKHIFTRYKPDAVIHLAALKAVAESAQIPIDYYDINVAGSVKLLQAMRYHSCFRLVFSSSATVYGNSGHCPIDESAGVSATNPYGRTKLFVEHLINDACAADPNFLAINLRYFNPVGAHKSGLLGEAPSGAPNNLMPYVAQVAAGIRPYLSVFGGDYPTADGTGVRDYIHVSDLARAHIRAVEFLPSLRDIQALNLGTGKGHSVLEVIKHFSDASGRAIPYKIIERRPGDVAQCWADPSLANERLDWHAENDITRMCEDAWRWQMSLSKLQNEES